MWIFYAIAVLTVALVSGCAVAPVAVHETKIPVPIVQECHDLDYGPAPDLSALAGLKAGDDPQHVIDVMGTALYDLAKDSARIRAMHLK